MKKIGDVFLSLIIPFICIYTAYILFYSYFLGGYARGGMGDVIVICLVSFFTVLGIFTLIRDLKILGIKETINLWKQLFKR